MKKNVIPAGLFYPGLKRLLQTMPLMAGMLLGGTTLAVANDLNPVVQEQQQSISVTGTVVDQNGEPLMGVNVIEKGTTNGTMTDMDGRFYLVGSGKCYITNFLYRLYNRRSCSEQPDKTEYYIEGRFTESG